MLYDEANLMTEHEMEIFHGSLERCLGGDGFVERFYELLCSRSPEIAAKFRDTDFKIQKRKLTSSLYMTMLLDDETPEGDVHFERIAQLHSRNALDIRPEYYNIWIECLIEAAREYDRYFDEETEKAWRHLMAPAMEFMKARYRRSAGPTDEDLGVDS
jgi:hemoglobin-like flavoprotein